MLQCMSPNLARCCRSFRLQRTTAVRPFWPSSAMRLTAQSRRWTARLKMTAPDPFGLLHRAPRASARGTEPCRRMPIQMPGRTHGGLWPRCTRFAFPAGRRRRSGQLAKAMRQLFMSGRQQADGLLELFYRVRHGSGRSREAVLSKRQTCRSQYLQRKPVR
jgi:hypothetical protein